MGLAEDKRAVRAQVRAQRRALSPAWVAEHSRRVAQRALALEEFAAARTVACYLALPVEVQTGELIERCRAQGKQVCVPARRAGDGQYALCWFDPRMPLFAGAMGVLEPASPAWAALSDVDLVFVPGLAFDAAGRRLGHGGGHYDRMLSSAAGAAERPVKAGLGFEFQLLEEVPAGAGDVRMHMVVTEGSIVRCGGGASGRENES